MNVYLKIDGSEYPISPEVVERIVDYLPEGDKVTKRIISKLADYPSISMKAIVAGNANIEEELWHRILISEDSSDQAVVNAINNFAHVEKISPNFLLEIMRKRPSIILDASRLVGMAFDNAAQKDPKKRELVDYFRNSKDLGVKYQVASSSDTPEEILKALLDDQNDAISMAAELNISNRM